MKSDLKRATLVAALALVWALGTYWTGHRRGDATGYARARAEGRAALVETIRVKELAYRTDTIRLWRRVREWETLYTTLTDTLRDTLRLRDTAWVRAALATADVTIRQCVSTVRTCEQRVALERQRAELAEETLTRAQHPPGLWRSVLTHSGAAVVGLALGRVSR